MTLNLKKENISRDPDQDIKNREGTRKHIRPQTEQLFKTTFVLQLIETKFTTYFQYIGIKQVL